MQIRSFLGEPALSRRLINSDGMGPISSLPSFIVIAKPNSGGTAAESASTVPTLGAVETMENTIKSMQGQDRQFGLSPMLAEGFRLRFEPSIEQALVYEKALNR